MMKKILLISFLFAQNGKQCDQQFILQHGTVILTFITKDTIWIAADSKVRYLLNKNSNLYQTSTICKIHNYKNINYTTAGMPLISQPQKKDSIVFDADAEILKVLKLNKPVVESVQESRKIISEKINAVYRQMIDRSDSEFKNYVFGQASLLHISISSFYNNKPIHFSWIYKLTGDRNQWSIKDSMLTEINADVPNLHGVFSPEGTTDSIMIFISNNSYYFGRFENMNEKLTNLIKIQMLKDSTGIGCPIMVKALYHNGSKWLTPHNLVR